MSITMRNIIQYVSRNLINSIWGQSWEHRSYVPDCFINDGAEAYSTASRIVIGTQVPKRFNITVYEALMHEILHVKFKHHVKELFPGYTAQQINLAGDMEINSILRLNLPSMNVLHPEKYGLPVGLTTKEYLELMFKENDPSMPSHFERDADSCPRHDEEGEIANPNAMDPDFGTDQLNIDGTPVRGHHYEAIIELADFKNVNELREKGLLLFLKEARLKARIMSSNSSRAVSYKKLNKRDVYDGIITPGRIKTQSTAGNLRGYLPIIFMDVSSSTSTAPVAMRLREVLKYSHKDFVIAMYNGGLANVITPQDRKIAFGHQGGTNLSSSLHQFKEEYPDMWNSLSDVFVITDGEDKTIPAAALICKDAGKGFKAQFISPVGASQRVYG